MYFTMAVQRGSVLDLLSVFFLVQPKTALDFCAAVPCSWLMIMLLSSGILRAFSAYNLLFWSSVSDYKNTTLLPLFRAVLNGKK